MEVQELLKYANKPLKCPVIMVVPNAGNIIRSQLPV